jgi:malonate-semialdehyde dehydrogenase (acetylating)/methylmalonate-semialdehyde dehydrogenase
MLNLSRSKKILTSTLGRYFSKQTHLNYINGQWKTPIKSMGTYEIKDPSTNLTVADLELSCEDCIDEAVLASKNAFEEWREVSVSNRVRVMLEYQKLIRDNMDWLAETITEEQGKTMIGKHLTIRCQRRCVQRIRSC